MTKPFRNMSVRKRVFLAILAENIVLCLALLAFVFR